MTSKKGYFIDIEKGVVTTAEERDAEIRADAIRKFAEWVDENYETEHYIPCLVEFYEKEQKE